MQINKVILLGYVGENPEINYFSEKNCVARFYMATNETYKNSEGKKIKNTLWHKIVLWKKLAVLAEKYIKKGMLLYVEGKINYITKTDKHGKQIIITEIIGDKITLGKNILEKNENEKKKKKKFNLQEKFDSLPF